MLKYLMIKPKKIFLSVLFFFESDFILSCFQFFLFKMHFCVFLQKQVQRLFREKLATQSFPRKVLKGNKFFDSSHRNFCDCLATNSFSRNAVWPKLDFSKFRQKLSQLYRYCLMTYSFSRKFFCFRGLFHDYLKTMSLLPNPRRMRVFNFIQQM